MFSKVTNKWKSHRCDVKGCKEGLVVCDANEKLCREICAAPAHLKLGVEMPKMLCKCGKSRAFGGEIRIFVSFATTIYIWTMANLEKKFDFASSESS